VNWDDVAYTCPRTKGVPRFLVKLRGELTAARPEIAMLAMTASNRNDIAAPLRSFASFEAIIPQRGSFEIHQTYHYKNFKNPEQDWGTLHYIEEGRFPPLPEDVQTRYDEWRIVQKRYVRSPQYRTDLRELMSYADSEGGDAKTPQNPEDLFTNEWLEGTLKELGFRYDTAKRAKLAKRCKDRITGHEGDSVKNRPQSIPADSKAVGNPEDTKAQFEDSQGWSDLTPHSIVEEKTE
jgi:hypothetical protein